MTIHDDLREVMGLLPCPFCGETPIIYDREHHPKRDCWTVICNNDDCPACLVYADRDTEAEAIEAWNTRPALLARQEGEDRLRDLHHAISLVYGCVPNLPIDESTMDAATDALHNFCLMVGIHEVDVDSPIDEAARSGGGG